MLSRNCRVCRSVLLCFKVSFWSFLYRFIIIVRFFEAGLCPDPAVIAFWLLVAFQHVLR